MATTYHYRLFNTEFGPVGFRELVALVRDGTITTDDLVKADWEQEWHPAAEVVGLFHMAGRADVLEKWEAERSQQAAKQAAKQTASHLHPDEAAADEQGEEVPAWQLRLHEVEQQLRALEAEQERERREELDEARVQKRIQDTVAAAEQDLDRKQARRRLGRLERWKNVLFSSSTMHYAFRCAMTIAATYLVAFGILTWSETEAGRYPPRPGAGQRPPVFPMWGECSRAEYLFLLGDAMVLAGLAGYGGARVLESMADD